MTPALQKMPRLLRAAEKDHRQTTFKLPGEQMAPSQ